MNMEVPFSDRPLRKKKFSNSFFKNIRLEEPGTTIKDVGNIHIPYMHL